MSTFNVVNLGCKVNRVESDTIERLFAKSGFVHSSLSDADIVVVNTCTVTGEAEKKARKAVRHALGTNSSAPIIVTGCASAICPEVFSTMDSRVEVVPKALIEKRVLSASLDINSDLFPDTERCDPVKRTRQGIKVQDGCDNECTYCIVRIARGKSVSIDRNYVIEQALRLCSKGVKEIVLSGINIGAYCKDGCTLDNLVRDLLIATSSSCNKSNPSDLSPRFRLSSIEPQSITEQLIDVIANTNGRVCRHLHIPLQSGSSKVLSDMGRNYSADEYLELMDSIRRAIPKIALTTDVIVGFPGESEEDFTSTCELARACAFSKIHVFPYSKRLSTQAAGRKDQIASDVKADRAQRLRALSNELRQQDFESRIGDIENFLIQENNMMMSESYHELPSIDSAPVGGLLKLRFPGLLIE